MKKDITILITSDIHGYIFPTHYRDRSDQPLGLAKLATYIKKKRSAGNVLLLDNGDLIQGSPLTYYHSKYHRDTENPVIKVANALGYHSAVFGNHEFNYGLDYLRSVVEQSEFPWLSANVINEQTGKPAYGKPYRIHEIEGVKIAVLGITTHFVPNWEDPNHIKGLKFGDALETAKVWVAKIRKEENPDVMVVSYHGGFERDLDTGEPTERLTRENQGYQMCQEIKGLDILITGHQHRSLAGKVNGVTIVQPSNHGQKLGEIQISLFQEGDRYKIDSSSSQLIEVANLTTNKDLQELIADFEDQTQQWLDTPIGEVEGDLSITDPLETRLKDTPFIEFINKVQMDATGVDISNTSLFNNDSPGFGQKVTMRDIVSNYVYPNTLSVIRITGQDVKDALEQSASYFNVVDGKITVNPSFMEPKPQHYNYDMWEGIEYELNVSNPVGERVTKLNYQGQSIDENKEYEVVMNNYRAGGAGNFDMYIGKPLVKEIPIDMTELIANYLLDRKTIQATCNHNWKVVQ
ncbi:bifunctional metallophosphatase/5'-nucleotidase [Radiobacillus kanasensis]|uniref:bifunctional metallophosphatase/5'-nucleotidase n=1 Tax=Radiobacillus kanasensis TaxID=2844358 RepID=UPI001E58D368|nr:bifunctional UDP-sugar hydrolase/5'-nucleotidase [Radiobacillus kanasensis]UFT99075.1 bifunctional metallophosphatase/5'-nucleotidase [Radiobacillus kanasensis]